MKRLFDWLVILICVAVGLAFEWNEFSMFWRVLW
jgi:hypothetical protein